MYLLCYPSNTTLVCKDKENPKTSICVLQCTQYKNNNIHDTIPLDTSSNIAQVSEHCLT